jgi:uncharacterized protein YidB (DUF937 family)
MANNGMPSMMALLGLLAVAGYQNRDKISEALRGMQTKTANAGGGTQDPLGGVLGGLADMFSGKQSPGNVLTGGLGDLMDSFRKSGQSDTADSWVKMGVPTRGLSSAEVERAVGADNIEELSRRIGISRNELLDRLATAIPDAVDRATPNGEYPASDDDIRRRVLGT